MHPPSKFGLFFGGLAEKTQLRENRWPGAPYPASPICHCLRRFVIACKGLLLEDPNIWLSSASCNSPHRSLGQRLRPVIYTVRLHQKQSGVPLFAAGATVAATRFARGAVIAGAGFCTGRASCTGDTSACAIATTSRLTDWACAVGAMQAIEATVSATAAGLAIILKNDITQLLF